MVFQRVSSYHHFAHHFMAIFHGEPRDHQLWVPECPHDFAQLDSQPVPNYLVKHPYLCMYYMYINCIIHIILYYYYIYNYIYSHIIIYSYIIMYIYICICNHMYLMLHICTLTVIMYIKTWASIVGPSDLQKTCALTYPRRISAKILRVHDT